MTEHTTEQHTDLLIREIVAEAEMAELAGMLMFAGWAVDMHTFPGTLAAAKNTGTLFYPAGAGGQWDITITEKRPMTGLDGPPEIGMPAATVVTWQARVSQSTPLHKVAAMAELAAGGTMHPINDVEDFFRTDDLAADDDDQADGEDCTGR